jgi:heterogeneous nuclear ribonucleoprotein U-like protein 1
MTQFNKTCYLMVGLPGSGKTTASEKLIKDITELTIASSDNFTEQYAKEHNQTYQEAYFAFGNEAEKMMKQQIQQLIKDERNFIWDQTNVYASSRKKKISMLTQKKYQVVAIVVELSSEELSKRLEKREKETGKKVPKKIIQTMLDNYTRPNYEEGFSDIYLISDNNEAILLPKEGLSLTKKKIK